MKKPGSHVCRERRGFEVYMLGYPHVIKRCSDCGAPMQSTPIDDLDAGDLDLACEMMRRFRLNGYHDEGREES